MNGDEAPDPRKLTFSQAQGYEELPRPLRLGELSIEARTRLWNILYRYVAHDSKHESHMGISVRELDYRWTEILVSLHENFHKLPIDEFSFPYTRLGNFVSEYKPILMNASFNKVFDLLLEIMRHPHCSKDFSQSVSHEFEKSHVAYVVDLHSPVTIYPAVTKEEGKAVIQATAQLTSDGLVSAVTHLRKASDNINQGDYPSAVRESIHAVESTARQVDSNARTLEPALRTLEKAGALHPALKQAFSNLYGYTSDEQGVRHALIDNPRANVGQDEAVFMLGACASFSSYLARKRRGSTS